MQSFLFGSQAQSAANIGGISIGQGHDLALIAGPCVIESQQHTMQLAEALKELCEARGLPLIFKASFDKANRSSIKSYRGPGLEQGISILAEVGKRLSVPVISDVHEPHQASAAGEVLDCIQIPAFLCRQTDLIVAAARTGRCVNVKKGQFLSPEEMENVAAKLHEAGCTNFLFTERGTFFGYNRLVTDMTAIPRMQMIAPVVFDATHSCQHPGAAGVQSGGAKQFAGTLAAAAIAAGADALFMEVHDDPANALSDPATVFPLDEFGALLDAILPLARIVRSAR